MTTPQLALPLALQTSTQFADFVVGDNQILLDSLHEQRTGLKQPLVYLSGEPKSGRTHLLMAQCNAAEQDGLQASYLPCGQLAGMPPDILGGLEQNDLLAIDDVHLFAGNAAWEEACFNLFNRARDRRCRLLFSGEQAPAASNFELADLSSRLAWGLVYRLKPLDDTGRRQLLVSLSARYGLEMPTEVAHYLVQRQPRDAGHLLELIEHLDKTSLREQRCLTVPFVKKHLAGC